MFSLQRRAVAFTRIRDVGGQKSLTFEVNTALRIHSTHPAAFPATGGRIFFKSLTYLGPWPKAIRSHPPSPDGKTKGRPLTSDGTPQGCGTEG
jgi:hypothetical protein